MRSLRRWLLPLAISIVLAVMLALVHRSFGSTDSPVPQRDTKTVCVGRFLIDLPAYAEVSLDRAFIHGFDIKSRQESEDQFQARVARHEAEINSKTNSLGLKNLELSKEVRGSGYFGKILISGRWRTHWFEGRIRKEAENVAVQGFIFAGGRSFDFNSDGYDPAQVENLARLISQFRPNPGNGIPSEPGFCIDGAIISDPLAASQRERVVMFAGLPGHPDIAIAFSTTAGTRPGPGLIERDAAAAGGEPGYVKSAFTKIRGRSRTINGLPGEELVLRAREPNFTTTFSFDLEMAGNPDEVLAPLLKLELEAGIPPRPGAKPVQSSLGEPALIELWEKISSSIRIRATQPHAPANSITETSQRNGRKPAQSSLAGRMIIAGREKSTSSVCKRTAAPRVAAEERA